MYMSKLCLNPVAMAGAGIYDTHRALWKVFGRDPDQGRDFLYRTLEGWNVLAVSAEPPLESPLLRKKEVKPYDPKLRVGERVLLSLRVNPVRKRRDEQGRQVRVDVVQNERRRLLAEGALPEALPNRVELAEGVGLEWLARRQESLGLELDEGTFMAESYAREEFRKPDGRPVVLGRLDLRVFARVTDPEQLREALFRGVGCAKGFGFGLPLVRRA